MTDSSDHSSKTRAPVGVLGAGSWGTALALLIARAGTPVTLWAHRPEHVSALNAQRENARYLPGIRFPDNLIATDALDDIARASNDIVAVVPSHAFASTLEALSDAMDIASRDRTELTLTSGTKGFEPDTGAQLGDVVARVLPGIACRAIVSGPTFAREVANNLPAAMTIAGSDSVQLARVADLFRGERMRIYPNDDFVGVQTAGAIKNVMAIATGISDGLQLGANARAALITRGLAELGRLGARLGGRPETFMGLAGVGDLVLTCTDDQSRNRRLGLGLGQGKTRIQVLADIGQEAEGVNTCREVHRMATSLGLQMPVTEQVHKVLFEDASPAQAVTNLLAREPRAE